MKSDYHINFFLSDSNGSFNGDTNVLFEKKLQGHGSTGEDLWQENTTKSEDYMQVQVWAGKTTECMVSNERWGRERELVNNTTTWSQD